MSFHWTGEGLKTLRSQDFPTRVDAEAWLTESYTQLVDEGVTSVSLYEDGSLVYGPMSLLPE